MCCLQAILERTNHKIEELHLDGNSITDAGIKALQRESQNEANDSHGPCSFPMPKAPVIDSALLVTGRKRTATAHARPEVHWLWMDFDRQRSGQGNWSCVVVERLVVECQAM